MSQFRKSEIDESQKISLSDNRRLYDSDLKLKENRRSTHSESRRRDSSITRVSVDDFMSYYWWYSISTNARLTRSKQTQQDDRKIIEVSDEDSKIAVQLWVSLTLHYRTIRMSWSARVILISICVRIEVASNDERELIQLSQIEMCWIWLRSIFVLEQSLVAKRTRRISLSWICDWIEKTIERCMRR